MPLIYGKVKDTEIVVPLQVDANGVIYVAENAPNPAAQLEGYVAGSFQKAPIPFGASNSLSVIWNNLACAAGYDSAISAAVPAGSMWVITNYQVRADGTCNFLRPGFILNTVEAFLGEQYTVVSTHYYRYECLQVMFPGDTLKFTGGNLTAGDDIYGACLGYQIDIDL